MMDSKSKSTNKLAQTSKNQTAKSKNPFADVAVISLNDFQRIQQATKSSNIHEEHNAKHILKVQTEQKLSDQKNLKDRMKDLDYEKHKKEKASNIELDEQTTNKLLLKVNK